MQHLAMRVFFLARVVEALFYAEPLFAAGDVAVARENLPLQCIGPTAESLYIGNEHVWRGLARQNERVLRTVGPDQGQS
jgi:hypothetical protein